MKVEKKFMELAIEEARKSKELLKCGAVIVKNNQVISKSFNSQRASSDASSHGEINAIRIAGKKLGSKYLDGCDIYCTCEPCVMCLSAIVFAKIKRLVYGTNLKDVSPKEKLIDIDIEMFLEKTPYRLEVVKNFMKEECKM